MSTKKIRNLTITATIPASDDYDVIDGEVNGTRKILSSAREYVVNKEQTALDTSFTKYPCNNVVKNAVDAKASLTGAIFTGSISATNLSGTNTGDETETTIKTKLDITTLSGSNTGDQDLSGLVPKTTTVNGHALSDNVTVSSTDVGAPTLSSGTTAPTSTPAKIGDMYVDTVLKHTYVANGTTSSANWIKQNGSYLLTGFSQALNSPVDATIYYMGAPIATVGLSLSATNAPIIAPRLGVINRIDINIINGTIGTSETSSMYLRLNNTTDYLISNAITNNGGYSVLFSNTALSIPISAGDTMKLKWITPTWGTNPVNVSISFQINVDL